MQKRCRGVLTKRLCVTSWEHKHTALIIKYQIETLGLQCFYFLDPKYLKTVKMLIARYFGELEILIKSVKKIYRFQADFCEKIVIF